MQALIQLLICVKFLVRGVFDLSTLAATYLEFLRIISVLFSHLVYKKKSSSKIAMKTWPYV